MSGDAITLAVYNNLFAAIAEEMGHALMRSAFSANIKERRDFSCAIFDPRSRMIAQAAHIPVHLGAAPMSVAAVIEALSLGPGESALVNDPYAGGTHLPDITVVTPIHVPGEAAPVLYVANRAHHADVGGDAPGSMPLAKHIDEEGVRIPPTLWSPELEATFLAQVRSPRERAGDLRAQFAANHVGVQRLTALIEERGLPCIQDRIAALFEWSKRMMSATLATLPQGMYSAEDWLDDDGATARDIRIAADVHLGPERVVVDFTKSADQVPGSVNAVRAIAVSAVHYVFRCLGPESLPSNDGFMECIEVRTRPGSIVDALPPAAVNAGNVETSQRIVDVLLQALATALPDRIPASSCGTMSNLLFGGTRDDGEEFTYYETLAGGSGAGPSWIGESAVQTHMTNTLNTPVEAMEHAYPVRVETSTIRRGSGGEGARRGGDGMVRELHFLADAEVTLIAERHRRPPPGLRGGEAGSPGIARVFPREGAPWVAAAKCSFRVRPGDRVRIETPGGGGHGPAEHPSKPED